MRLAIFAAALAAILVLAGCGASPPRHPPRPAGTPASCHQLGPPCSAIVPEGARGKDVSRYVAGSPPLTLTGGAIQVDNFGAELTAGFENVYQATYCPYWDPYGRVWTRGYGETDWSGNFGGRCISHAEAVRNVRYLLDTQYCGAVRALGVNLSHPQVDALCDLSYNVGPGTICCTLASLLRAHAWYSAAIYIRRYSYAGGQFLSGLYDRRVREGELLQIVEHSETSAQRRARERRELPSDEHTLAELRIRIVVLRRVLLADGCDRRRDHHRHLGPKCARWFREGNTDHARGIRLDGQVKALRRELG